MKNPLKALFTRRPAANGVKLSEPASQQHAGDEAAHRLRLVEMSLRELMQRSGIPVHWLECATLIVSSRRRGDGLYVHLLVRHGHEQLLPYSPAFQSELKAAIVKADRRASQWLHGIAWNFGTSPINTFEALPDAAFWHNAAAEPGEATLNAAPLTALLHAQLAPGSTDDAALQELEQDLQTLLAICDSERSALHAEDSKINTA